MENYYVYILTNWNHKVFYVGFTNDLIRRIFIHKNKVAKGFTQKYNVNKLVYYEVFDNYDEALKFEKLLKKWRRNWKFKLIEKNNPKWDDLYKDIID